MAGNPAENAVFMLQTYQVVSIEVKEFGGAFIRGPVFLGELKPYPLGILIARIWVIDWNGEEAAAAVFGRYCCA